ncbi:MAG: PH domain-containing protein [Muribaculum sp.]|nr:PH domain-containing protein [Muribaculum sp.]
MKRKVNLSTYSMIMSVLGLIVLVAWLYYCRDNWGLYVIGASLILLCGAALFYMPMSISADSANLNINRPLKIKSIPLKAIETVKLCSPTMTEKRICGSGGWFGYWGWFSEPSIGKYFAYYGKASDCFLVELKNGKKYLISCADAPKMVEVISERISK